MSDDPQPSDRFMSALRDAMDAAIAEGLSREFAGYLCIVGRAPPHWRSVMYAAAAVVTPLEQLRPLLTYLADASLLDERDELLVRSARWEAPV